MAIPTAPFCLSSDVAPYMSVNLKSQPDYKDGMTTPSKTSVDIFISNVSSQILARFRRAGYVTPLTTDGVTWPDDQTDFLSVLCVMGVCGILTGPFVANPGRRNSDGNPYETRYLSDLSSIFEITKSVAGPFLGCQYRSMTPAERAVGIPAIPTTSVLLEQYDPAANTGFEYWTNKSQEMQDYMEALLPLHNYDYGLNDLNKGPYV